jgi:AbiV family abortive infection protein
MDVAVSVLLKGAWYAFEQCGNLLRHVKILYQREAYSSAVALAMIGREELGKYRILLGAWKRAYEGGKCPTVGQIRKALDDHIEKQRQAVLSITFMAEGPSVLDTAIRNQMAHHPWTPEHRAADQTIQANIKRMGKRAPVDRHKMRMQTLYVDLNDTGTDWSRPTGIHNADVERLLSDAANDYAVQRDKILNPLREGKPELDEALQAWPDRPELPGSEWPNL